jgi:hypothetical protein
VKRQDDRKIGPAEPIVGENNRRGGDATAGASAGDVHHQAKIQMTVIEAGDNSLRRFAEHRKNSDAIGRAAPRGSGAPREIADW